MKYFLIILFACCNFGLVAQNYSVKSKKAIASFEAAQTSYANERAADALKHLDGAINKEKAFIEAYLLKADIYFNLKQYQNEVQALEKALAIDSTFFVPALFNMGVAKYNTGEYDEVRVWMEAFIRHNKNKRTKLNPEFWIEKAQFAKEAIVNPIYIEPYNLGENINSQFDEYWPSLSADGETMIFTVLVPKDPLITDTDGLAKNAINFREDFYVSYKKDGEWLQREPLVSLNTNSNEGAQALSADGNWMFFTACGRRGGKGSCDIWFSRRVAEGWSKPVNLGAPVNTPFWESQPSFSSDGRTLYFVSNRPGGKGGKDIWKSTIIGYKEDGSPFFGKVENLGDNINSAEDENSPFIHLDNQTLYFSSDGWPGMGAMDLFYSRYDSVNGWSRPVNLGYPLNTEDEEIGLVINAKGDLGYFSSNGLDNREDKDLYQFTIPQKIRPMPVTYIKGRVYDSETNETLSADIKINKLPGGQLSVNTFTAPHSGEFLFCLPAGDTYALNIQKEGYLFYSDNFDVSGNGTIEKPQVLDVYLSQIKEGASFVLRNVFFETDSYQLKAESHTELDYVVRLLQLNPTLKVEIGGHTDNTGSRDYNLSLSEQRAKAVYQYIEQKGIDVQQLHFRGYGFDRPIESNDTEEGKAKNRRTELKVIEK
ncbi:PD40 domain-containing protein [Carboxylicivirga mesophila]|uniref:PD40 domain-containing protein n=1 Tax=Carboxylicivirga mesophila TaxID=1166478 RepID=A0ABS5K8T3_9BACT|nr:OmpA family protein [Carboxylicivirga mesophila]MBS2210798.1 PD40 domain-containing protein [Carboxylicivirga mesophila]